MAHITWIAGALGGVLGVIYWASPESTWAAGLALVLLGVSGLFAGISLVGKK